MGFRLKTKSRCNFVLLLFIREKFTAQCPKKTARLPSFRFRSWRGSEGGSESMAEKEHVIGRRDLIEGIAFPREEEAGC